nr:peroxidase 9 [Tanacetum cinerariifolium]
TSLNHEEDDQEIDELQSDINLIRRSTRTRHAPDLADTRAIRILIAIAAYYDYEIWQIDVKTAFHNAYLNEEVYMEQPEEKLKLSKSQGASTPAELKRMKNVPYASATGYVFVLNGGVVDWKSAKQSIFATSSAEAKYIVVFDASKEAV